MCEVARVVHAKSKLTKNHTIREIADPESTSRTPLPIPPHSSDLGSIDVICPVHRDAYRYFDQVCQVRICRDCFALNHHGHRCVSIEEGVAEKRRLCEEQHARGSREKEEFAGLVRSAKAWKEEVDKKYKEVKEAIHGNAMKVSEGR